MSTPTAELSRLSLPDGRAVEIVRLSVPGRSASVVPAMGGELSSYKIEWRGAMIETLYRAENYGPPEAPSGWTGRAPLLWPQPGRVRVPGVPVTNDIGAWRVEDKVYPMPGHGFVMRQPWKLEGQGHDSHTAWAKVSLTDNDVSRPNFPFAFRLECEHCLDAQALRLRYRVINRETARAIPFALGNHITLKMPFTGRGRYDDGVVWSPTATHLEIGPDAQLTGRTLRRDLSNGRCLSDMTLCDAMFGDYAAPNAVVEVWDGDSFGMRVRQRVISGPDPGDAARRFVFWSEPKFRYFCPEPWLGEPNSLNTHNACVTLPPGETFVWEVEFEPILDQSGLSFDPAMAV